MTQSKTPQRRSEEIAEAQDQAAADLSLRIVDLLNLALSSSGLTQKDLAELVGVGESRVSQVLHGDGNVHIATFAKYMRAMGYGAAVNVLPATPDARPFVEPRPRKRRGSKSEPKQDHVHIFHQPYIDTAGAAIAFTVVRTPHIEPDGWMDRPIQVTTINGETKEVTNHPPRSVSAETKTSAETADLKLTHAK